MRHSMRYTSHSKRQYAPFSLNKIKHLFFFNEQEGRILALTVRRVAHTVAHGGAYWRLLWVLEHLELLGVALGWG